MTRAARAAPATARAPAPAVLIGAAGLVPFVGLAALTAFVPASSAFSREALLHYGAIILAFVGALHWGYAVRRAAHGISAWIQYGWSVVPALVAWATLQMPVSAGLRLQAAMLVACFAIDHALQRIDPSPRWLLRLRAVLTAVAATSLALASFV